MRTPLVPLSVCAILMLAACGNDESVSSPTDPSLLPPMAVNVVSSGGDGAEATTMDVAAQNESAGSTDTDRSTGLMPAFVGYVFEIGEGLPTLPTDSTGYHFPAGVGVDAAEVSRIADALGVAGVPEPAAADSGNQWRVGPEDGSAPALFVANDGQVSWYYSYAWAAAEVAGCGVSGDVGSGDVGSGSVGDGTTIDIAPKVEVAVGADQQVPTSATPDADQPPVVEECPTPEPPAGVPTAEEAAAKANELLTELGEDPAAFEFETYADEWSASVTAFPTVDGVRWPLAFGFGFGGEGALQWANGTLAEPVATGPYPLVDLDTAIARLQDQNGMWGYGGGDVLAVDARAAEETTARETQAGETQAGEPSAGDPSTVEPATPETKPVETVVDDGQTMPVPPDEGIPPTPEPVVATLVDVEADLWWAWDADSTVWFLPAYKFTDTEGNVFTVPAVTDEYMMVVEPTIEPQPEPVPAEPLDPIVKVPTTDVLIDPPRPDDPFGAADPAVLNEFVGIPLKEFEELAKRYGFATRVTRQDGVDLSVTMDYSESRVNVAVKDDIVVEVVSFG